MISAPKILARYRGVMWEPIENTGERVFAILCVEPLGPEAEHLAPQAYVLLSAERLRSLLGRARGDSASAMLNECAAFMTDRLVRGAPIEQVQPLFHSFSLGPVQQARAYSVEQFLDATVRTLTVFGSAADLYAPDLLSPPNATRRTSEFIRQIRRTFAAGDDERQSRFHVRLQREQDAPIVFIDYAVGPVVLQVASVPSSPNQAPPAEAELKGKILDLEVVRTEFGVNRFEPTLMLNVRSLTEAPDSDGTRIAKEAHEQIRRYAEWAKVRVIEVTSAGEASSELERLEALLR